MTSIHDLIINRLVEEQSRKIEEFFMPYVRVYCSADPLTAEAVAAAGLTMASSQGGGSITYQLCKDDKAVSPAYIIDYSAFNIN